MTATLPQKVRICEVGPRDGLQNEKEILTPMQRADLVDRLAAAGLDYIEAGSFVSPQWVPQMADSGDVLALIRRRPGVSYPVLVPNEKGMDLALAAGVEEIAVFTAASESFTRRNINCTIAESLARFAPVMLLAQARGIAVRGYVSCAVFCPYEGRIAPEKVAALAADLYAMGCREISLGDTIGRATPGDIGALAGTVAAKVPLENLALHCHDTYGQALANIYAGLQAGISVIDSSIAGLGGCPYAKGASGNVATEDVLYMLDGLNIKTGVDLRALVDAAWFAAGCLGREPSSKTARAMGPPEG